MANLNMEIKNSKFVSHNGVNVEIFTENYVLGNDWECRVSETGRIDCISTQFYNGERHQIKLKIDKGYVKVLLKIGDAYPKVLKSFKLDEWPVDGVIVLPAGYIDKRRPHFRTANFQKFLNEHGLTAVHHESANGIYQAIQSHNGYGVVFFEKIETDGIVKQISEEVDVDEKSAANPFVITRKFEVIDASWVIKTVWKLGECQHRILYTLDNPKQIVGLPKTL